MKRILQLFTILMVTVTVWSGRSSGPSSAPLPLEDLRLDPQGARALIPETAAGEAFRFYRDKRLRYSRRIRPERAYARARAHLDDLPRHALGRGVPRPLGPSEAGVEGPTWQPLGPGNIGGRTRAMVIHPNRAGTLYAAGVSGGVWKTTDGGRLWRPLSDGMANLSVNALAMDPVAPDTLYAGTGEGYFREAVRGTSLPLRGAGIFKTADGGSTWTRLPSTTGAAFRWVNDIVVSHNDPLRVYAATRRGVYRSLDGGESWTRTLAVSVKGGCLDLDVRRDADSDYLFASCGTLAPGTVYRNPQAQADGAWQPVLAEPGMGRTSIAVAPSSPQTVYALAASNVSGTYLQGLHALYRSDESGAPGSWRVQADTTHSDKLQTLLLSNPVIAFVEECGFGGTNSVFNMGWYTNTLAVDPVDPEIVWVGGVDLFRSDDGGRTFGQASHWFVGRESSSFVHADQHGVVFDPRFNGSSNRRMYSLNDGGVYRTNNARGPVAFGTSGACGSQPALSWTELNNGYGVTQFYHGSVLPDGRRYLAGAQDNGTVLGVDSRGRDGWRRVLGGDGAYSALPIDSPEVAFASIQGGRVFRSTTGVEGEYIEQVSGIDDLPGEGLGDFRARSANFLFISPLIADPNQGSRLWLGGSRLWRTDNHADSWQAASSRLAGKVSAIAVAPGNPDVVIAGTHSGRIYRQDGATTSDGDSAWDSTRPRPGFVSSVAFDPTDTSVVYATYANFSGAQLWRSLDGGESFQPLGNSGPQRLPILPTHAVVIDPTDSTRLFVGTDLGVLVSLDGGETWAVENSGFANVVTEWLTAAERNGRPYLYAFTHGRGAWRAALD